MHLSGNFLGGIYENKKLSEFRNYKQQQWLRENEKSDLKI